MIQPHFFRSFFMSLQEGALLFMLWRQVEFVVIKFINENVVSIPHIVASSLRFCWLSQQGVRLNPVHDTCVLEQDTFKTVNASFHQRVNGYL